MGDSIENKAEEQQTENNASGGFDFSNAEELLNGEASEKPSENTLEGEIETKEDVAKVQSKAVTRTANMFFTFMGNEPYQDAVYKEAERNLAPAIISVGFKIPFIEVINGIVWFCLLLSKSFKELKSRKGGESAEQKHEQTEQ